MGNAYIRFQVPDTIQRGQDFTVRVRTYGGGCVRQGFTDVELDGLRATVTPYDIHSGASACTSELRLFQHGATLRFDRAGTARVTIHGMKHPDDDRITEERTVVVM